MKFLKSSIGKSSSFLSYNYKQDKYRPCKNRTNLLLSFGLVCTSVEILREAINLSCLQTCSSANANTTFNSPIAYRLTYKPIEHVAQTVTHIKTKGAVSCQGFLEAGLNYERNPMKPRNTTSPSSRSLLWVILDCSMTSTFQTSWGPLQTSQGK